MAGSNDDVLLRTSNLEVSSGEDSPQERQHYPFRI
jgi:hypothetical protein